MLPDLLTDFLSDTPTDDLWLTCEEDGTPFGFCYATPERMADGTWNMLALAVLPERQGHSFGRDLVAALEAQLRTQGARVLLADTSGTDDFAATRAFYIRQGYTQEARIRDFWADGDDKIVFWKSLSATT